METISISNVLSSESPEKTMDMPINSVSISNVLNEPKLVSISEAEKTDESPSVPQGIDNSSYVDL